MIPPSYVHTFPSSHLPSQPGYHLIKAAHVLLTQRSSRLGRLPFRRSSLWNKLFHTPQTPLTLITLPLFIAAIHNSITFSSLLFFPQHGLYICVCIFIKVWYFKVANWQRSRTLAWFAIPVWKCHLCLGCLSTLPSSHTTWCKALKSL